MAFVTSTNSETETCVHEACNCKVENAVGSEGYCSPTCGEANESAIEGMCACGHPACDSPE